MTTNLASRNRWDPAERQLHCDGDDADDHDTPAVVWRQVSEDDGEDYTCEIMLAKARRQQCRLCLPPKFPIAPVKPETMPLAKG